MLVSLSTVNLCSAVAQDINAKLKNWICPACMSRNNTWLENKMWLKSGACPWWGGLFNKHKTRRWNVQGHVQFMWLCCQSSWVQTITLFFIINWWVLEEIALEGDATGNISRGNIWGAKQDIFSVIKETKTLSGNIRKRKTMQCMHCKKFGKKNASSKMIIAGKLSLWLGQEKEF